MSHAHNFVSAVADGADATLMRPSNWNDAHCGIGDDEATPDVDQVVRPAHSACIHGLPLIIASGRLVDIQAGGVLVIQP